MHDFGASAYAIGPFLTAIDYRMEQVGFVYRDDVHGHVDDTYDALHKLAENSVDRFIKEQEPKGVVLVNRPPREEVELHFPPRLQTVNLGYGALEVSSLQYQLMPYMVIRYIAHAFRDVKEEHREQLRKIRVQDSAYSIKMIDAFPNRPVNLLPLVLEQKY